MNKGINVLSLFDGISCGQIALQRAGIKVNNYFASEIDKHAIKVTQQNWPNTVQLGDVTKWREWDIDWESIDLLCAGFPCQAWSFAGNQRGTNDPRGALAITLFELFTFLKEKNPKLNFLFENVRMKKEYSDYLNTLFGVKSVLIDSSCFSAQLRKRLYWTNLDIKQIEDKNILLKDIIEDGFVDKDKAYCIDASYIRNSNPFGYIKKSRGTLIFDSIKDLKRFRNMTREELLSEESIKDKCCRRLTRKELEMLQNIPESYTQIIEYNKAAHAIGNGWTVNVIAHIFSSLPKEFKNG